jgi:hypothetical protein
MTHRVYRHQVTPAITAGKEAMERMFAANGQSDPVEPGGR